MILFSNAITITSPFVAMPEIHTLAILERDSCCSTLTEEISRACKKSNIYCIRDIKLAGSYIEDLALDFVLLDWNFVGKSIAYHLSHKILKHHPNCILIAIISAHENSTIRTIFELGYFDFIRKPIKKLELEVRIRKAIRIVKHFRQVRQANKDSEDGYKKIKKHLQHLENQEKEIKASHDFLNSFFLLLMENFKASLKKSEKMANFVLQEVNHLTNNDITQSLIESFYLEMSSSMQLLNNLNIWLFSFVESEKTTNKTQINLVSYINSNFSKISIKSHLDEEVYNIYFNAHSLFAILQNLLFICYCNVVNLETSDTLSIHSTENYICISFPKLINEWTSQLFKQVIDLRVHKDLLHKLETHEVKEVMICLAIYTANMFLTNGGGYTRLEDNKLFIYLPKN